MKLIAEEAFRGGDKPVLNNEEHLRIEASWATIAPNAKREATRA